MKSNNLIDDQIKKASKSQMYDFRLPPVEQPSMKVERTLTVLVTGHTEHTSFINQYSPPVAKADPTVVGAIRKWVHETSKTTTGWTSLVAALMLVH